MGAYGSSGDDSSVSLPDDEGEEGYFPNVGEIPPEEPEDIELYDIEARSDGEVYEIMFVVDISSTGAEI